MRTIAPTRRSLLAAAIVSLTALAAASSTQAAVITWGAATGISADTDVSTNGTLVNAVNIGNTGVSSTTVNGVLFNALVLSGTTVSSGNFTFNIGAGTFSASNGAGAAAAPFTTLSASYQALLSTVGGDFSTPFTLTMSGLTVGQTYEVQLWSNNSGTGIPNQRTTASAGNVLTLNSNPGGLNGGLGEWGIGTFIADNASQVITFATLDTRDLLNAVQLRQVSAVSAVPEPGSALVGMLVLGLCGARLGRRR